jgi:pimeloyl-ACP methyl ester carboxylesterase
MATVSDGHFATLPNGTRLHFARAGNSERPLLLFLHGFPEFWYAWHQQLAHFGDTFDAVAPDLRGYNLSDQPSEVAAYRAKFLLQDIEQFIHWLGRERCVIVAHDWGGALAWQLAIQAPQLVERLLIVNATHPMPFAEALASDPAQQAASQYMNWLRAEGSEQALSKDDFRVMERMMLGEGAAWFDAATRARYHDCWSRGLRGGVNYYRASRIHPPTANEPGAQALALDPQAFRVRVPVRILWGEQDRALLPVLLDSLDRFVDDLKITRVPEASHWIVHEQPERVNRWIAESLID